MRYQRHAGAHVLKAVISIGDINGISLELALKNHEQVKQMADPLYCVDQNVLEQAAKLLNAAIPDDFQTVALDATPVIEPSKVTAKSGLYAFMSLIKALKTVESGAADFLVTLPISKEAWHKAHIPYVGHTDFFKSHYKKDAIMTLGCEQMLIALFTDHMPLGKVPEMIEKEPLEDFLLRFYENIRRDNIAVLGLNPHAGDGGVLGSEDAVIQEAIDEANTELGKEVFIGPLVPDVAFIPKNREHFKTYVAMYHDQGLIPLKTLYFDGSVNLTLDIPIIRTSPDHGCAFDIAYQNANVSAKSYINSFKIGAEMASKTN